jgi:hypothetical protein
LPATNKGRFSANYDGRKDVLSDLATDHHVTRREAAEALKALKTSANGHANAHKSAHRQPLPVHQVKSIGLIGLIGLITSSDRSDPSDPSDLSAKKTEDQTAPQKRQKTRLLREKDRRSLRSVCEKGKPTRRFRHPGGLFR